jgi:hypothetical protein
MTVKLHKFLSSVDAVDSASGFDVFTPGEGVFDTHWMGGWTGHTTALDVTTQQTGCAAGLTLHQSAACNAANRAVPEHFGHIMDNYFKTDQCRV